MKWLERVKEIADSDDTVNIYMTNTKLPQAAQIVSVGEDYLEYDTIGSDGAIVSRFVTPLSTIINLEINYVATKRIALNRMYKRE